MEKEVSASYEATKTNESCMLFNKSEDYSIMSFISITAIICLICFCISGEFECIPYCIATVICCFILIYIMHKCKQNKINKFIKNNKSNFIYRIDGRIYEFACESQKEYYQLKNKEYNFIVLTNQFSVNENGVAYVIRKKSTLSDPDAKIYIDQSCSEEISIFYDQITEIKTGKILTAAELKQFLKAEIMQMNKQIEEVFMKYSKPVIIQWLCTQYPVFFKDKKKIIRELNDCKDDIAFEKNHVEINMLIKRRNSLKSENFKDFHDYLLKKITLDKRIHYLLEKQENFLK